MRRFPWLAAVAVAALCDRADACTLVPDATELVPRSGATSVPTDSLLVFADWEEYPVAIVASTGMHLRLEAARLDGGVMAKAFRAVDGLPPDEEITLSDGRSFRTLPAGAEPPDLKAWQLKSAALVDAVNSGGCSSDSCDGLKSFVIVLRPFIQGDDDGYFHVFVAPRVPYSGALPEGGGAGPSPFGEVKLAFVRTTVSPVSGEMTIVLTPNQRIPIGSTIRLVPVVLSGMPGTPPLLPIKIADSSGGCRLVSGSLPAAPGIAGALLVAALVRRVRRGR